MEILQFLSGGFDILFTDLKSFRRNLLLKMVHANYRLRVTKKKHYMPHFDDNSIARVFTTPISTLTSISSAQRKAFYLGK